MTANAFADTNGHWAESAINKWSGEYGIIQGYDDGTFRPDKSITRGAFAGILDRFLHFRTPLPRTPSRIPPGPIGRMPS
ncbi:S-layer homology domain-containing protein [uncultured Dysosmobacter sp.]|uniref:S-layer homology domain-containing protein n=1 Tax=uncultured Dysosmobacter sp. TaxID=2591384 RepID=UPI00267128CF|nr:S-layer homology domain-containing protein [uncultured Dysosmobacter sp.]